MCVCQLLAWLKFKRKLELYAQQMLRLLRMNLSECGPPEQLFRSSQIMPNPQEALFETAI